MARCPMPETASQYIERILKHAEGLDAMAVLADTPARLDSLVRSTPPDRWRVRPAPARWSAGEVLAHLADAEIVTGWRMRSILASDGVPLQAFDQDVWAEAFQYGEVDTAESLATFSAARASCSRCCGGSTRHGASITACTRNAARSPSST